MNDQKDRQAYTLQATADALSVHVNTVRRLVDNGHIKAFRLGRLVRVPATEIHRLTDVGTAA